MSAARGARGETWRLCASLLVLFASLAMGCGDREGGFFSASTDKRGQIVRVSEVWKRDRIVLQGVTENALPAQARFGETCQGYVGEHPSFTLRLQNVFDARVHVEADTEADLVMVLAGRGGLRCSDDDQGLLPGLQARLSGGDYAVFVGTMDPDAPPVSYRLIVEPADPDSSFQGLSVSDVEAHLEALDFVATPVSPSAIAELEQQHLRQEESFEMDVPTRMPDVHARARHESVIVGQGPAGNLLREEFESSAVAALWQVAPACGGYIPMRGVDLRFRADGDGATQVECRASSDRPIELALWRRDDRWRCGGATGDSTATLRFDAATTQALVVTSVSPAERFRVLLTCDLLDDDAGGATPGE